MAGILAVVSQSLAGAKLVTQPWSISRQIISRQTEKSGHDE
jgi:hypothetical protein